MQESSLLHKLVPSAIHRLTPEAAHSTPAEKLRKSRCPSSNPGHLVSKVSCDFLELCHMYAISWHLGT